MKYQNFEELPIWIQARVIVNLVYSVTNRKEIMFKDQRFADQIRSAAISIMNNIAEGFDSGNKREFKRFLLFSQRSTSEVMSMSYLLNDLYKMENEAKEIYSLCLDQRKQIKGLIKYLETNLKVENAK
ncbi:MAG: four helix bundle protein [Bacteroidetes bacterium]|nr:four helix bundle protein [Bacteroidota bacterium]